MLIREKKELKRNINRKGEVKLFLFFSYMIIFNRFWRQQKKMFRYDK